MGRNSIVIVPFISSQLNDDQANILNTDQINLSCVFKSHTSF